MRVLNPIAKFPSFSNPHKHAHEEILDFEIFSCWARWISFWWKAAASRRDHDLVTGSTLFTIPKMMSCRTFFSLSNSWKELLCIFQKLEEFNRFKNGIPPEPGIVVYSPIINQAPFISYIHKKKKNPQIDASASSTIFNLYKRWLSSHENHPSTRLLTWSIRLLALARVEMNSTSEIVLQQFEQCSKPLVGWWLSPFIGVKHGLTINMGVLLWTYLVNDGWFDYGALYLQKSWGL